MKFYIDSTATLGALLCLVHWGSSEQVLLNSTIMSVSYDHLAFHAGHYLVYDGQYASEDVYGLHYGQILTEFGHGKYATYEIGECLPEYMHAAYFNYSKGNHPTSP